MIIAYYPIHYGSDYLGYSIKSIYDHVDQIHILYASKPSHGHRSNLVNPDSLEMLKSASLMFGDPGGKIVWHSGDWANETAQRSTIYKIAGEVGASMCLAVDADEIWDKHVLEGAIDSAFKNNKRQNLIRMLTFWRCFHKVAVDEFWPIRILIPNGEEGVHYLDGRVNHFGYARSIESIEYKISIHGHKNEWRKEWLDVYRKWPNSRDFDLHPTGKDVWSLSDFDKTALPEYMREHPYFNLERI